MLIAQGDPYIRPARVVPYKEYSPRVTQPRVYQPYIVRPNIYQPYVAPVRIVQPIQATFFISLPVSYSQSDSKGCVNVTASNTTGDIVSLREITGLDPKGQAVVIASGMSISPGSNGTYRACGLSQIKSVNFVKNSRY
jgi:hypothetical protein